ncbi:predicted protein [Histoplasma mississippiense (nom. inval.)]|uniref:predicted protein n=1 Tax=Ajellomyces capsulatus (strain NAm1 / WU24) TaxID=2059318 RepID=UPI000157B2D0|nr:predicted protein [Histoplasma mississippiense (nom. inval.)]EDN02313.1 predicted protein [Histoplasma mississippiense (nom. inval.)]
MDYPIVFKVNYAVDKRLICEAIQGKARINQISEIFKRLEEEGTALIDAHGSPSASEKSMHYFYNTAASALQSNANLLWESSLATSGQIGSHERIEQAIFSRANRFYPSLGHWKLVYRVVSAIGINEIRKTQRLACCVDHPKRPTNMTRNDIDYGQVGQGNMLPSTLGNGMQMNNLGFGKVSEDGNMAARNGGSTTLEPYGLRAWTTEIQPNPSTAATSKSINESYYSLPYTLHSDKVPAWSIHGIQMPAHYFMGPEFGTPNGLLEITAVDDRFDDQNLVEGLSTFSGLDHDLVLFPSELSHGQKVTVGSGRRFNLLPDHPVTYTRHKTLLLALYPIRSYGPRPNRAASPFLTQTHSSRSRLPSPLMRQKRSIPSTNSARQHAGRIPVHFLHNNVLLPSNFEANVRFRNADPLASQGLFRTLQSDTESHHHCFDHYSEFPGPPDLLGPLKEERELPPPEDMMPNDPSMTPHEQELRFENDLYTPKWVRGHGNKREGWCGICKPGRWLVLKNSAFWYDKSFSHGISAPTGKAFATPKEMRRTDGNTNIWEGLCGNCDEWIALVSSKKKGTTWFRHAYKARAGF